MPVYIRHLQVIALLAAVLLVGSNAFVLSPLLSEVAEGLATEPFRITWSISAFGAATAVSALTLARLIDHLPAGRVLGGAALILALAQASSGTSQNWLWLCLSQGVAGVAIGVLLPGAYATAAATAPKGAEASRLGIVLTGWALSLVLAVPLAAIVAERAGWRMVYALLAGLSVLTAIGLMFTLRGVHPGVALRTSAWQAMRLPGVAKLLVVMFAYMTAFYGSFAFFGEGVRQAFRLSTQGTGTFVLAYGMGFGLAGIGLGIVTPNITRHYMMLVLSGITISYACWSLALETRPTAVAAAVVWGALNQMGLNALIVLLSRYAAEARGAVMGMNSAVTYSAVFAGPLIMSPIYAGSGFTSVSALSAVFVAMGALVSWKTV
ncbi:Predicted arabinose efflux permease, MFS family [Halomonas sp. HL-93]|nr:MAG: Arabinose efflux permease [Halomonas sp. HL-93]SBR47222.1 Predicted arabinose efflux permease, MFS family [Halomonas sp. HL-93]